jgi:hypothetical protein
MWLSAFFAVLPCQMETMRKGQKTGFGCRSFKKIVITVTVVVHICFITTTTTTTAPFTGGHWWVFLVYKFINYEPSDSTMTVMTTTLNITPCRHVITSKWKRHFIFSYFIFHFTNDFLDTLWADNNNNNGVNGVAGARKRAGRQDDKWQAVA